MSDITIGLHGLGKMYKLYRHPADKVADALGINRLLFWRKHYYQEFWALRGLDLEIRRGERLGIIGSNGAGKSTMLKIIIGNVSATEGSVTVRGRVQALMELGTGFHPEFTGRQNIRASLAYQNLSKSEIREKEDGIIDFAELDEFIDHPVKTYSAGMYTRLAFSTATAIEPDILIIDEVLSAGDAYFSGKCVERIKRITEEAQATVLFVSHDIHSIERLCNRCIWLDRGRVVMDGPTLEVSKGYGRYIRSREERRLKAKNLKISLGGYEKTRLDQHADTFLVRFVAPDGDTEGFVLQHVTLLQNGESVGELALGEAQDSDPSHPSWVLLDKMSGWSDPVDLGVAERGRGLTPGTENHEVQGLVAFAIWVYDNAAEYSLRLKYMQPALKPVHVEVYNGKEYIPLEHIAPGSSRQACELTSEIPHLFMQQKESRVEAGVSRWPGSNELLIGRVILVDGAGQEKAVFNAGDELTLKMTFSAGKPGKYPVTFCAVLYRIDGIRLSCHLSDATVIEMDADERREIELDFGRINLGNGNYIFAAALYKSIDPELRHEPEIYDLHDRSYEFQIVGQSAVDGAIFRHPAEWRIPNVSAGCG